jgi:hypothetical protein
VSCEGSQSAKAEFFSRWAAPKSNRCWGYALVSAARPCGEARLHQLCGCDHAKLVDIAGVVNRLRQAALRKGEQQLHGHGGLLPVNLLLSAGHIAIAIKHTFRNKYAV